MRYPFGVCKTIPTPKPWILQDPSKNNVHKGVASMYNKYSSRN